MVFSILGKVYIKSSILLCKSSGDFLQQLDYNDSFLSFQIMTYKQQEECHTASETANGRKGEKGGTV